jgi:Protein of unknown function (DUF3455)
MRFSSTSLLSAFLLLLLPSTTIHAFPTAEPKRPHSPNHNTRKQSTGCPLTPPPALPASTLPGPNSNYTLKSIVLGRGTQNYTCADASSTPVANGARADLFDISCPITGKNGVSLVESYIPKVLSTPWMSLEGILENRFPAAMAGIHYFRDGTTPKFVLNDGLFIAAGKVAGCAAPGSATGNNYGAAVDWLKLARKPTEPSGGIEEVYRVQTAGGRAPATCSKAGDLTVDYAAEYWFFGWP